MQAWRPSGATQWQLWPLRTFDRHSSCYRAIDSPEVRTGRRRASAASMSLQNSPPLKHDRAGLVYQLRPIRLAAIERRASQALGLVQRDLDQLGTDQLGVAIEVQAIGHLAF